LIYKKTDERWDMVHFIGFNALNDCEKVMMRKFKEMGKARFYWDYDNSYIHEGKLNSAGFFLRDNLKVFGNDVPSQVGVSIQCCQKVHLRCTER
jgi:hypothetical protein